MPKHHIRGSLLQLKAPQKFFQRNAIAFRRQGLPKSAPEHTDCFFAGLGYDARILQDYMWLRDKTKDRGWKRIMGFARGWLIDIGSTKCLLAHSGAPVRLKLRGFSERRIESTAGQPLFEMAAAQSPGLSCGACDPHAASHHARPTCRWVQTYIKFFFGFFSANLQKPFRRASYLFELFAYIFDASSRKLDSDIRYDIVCTWLLVFCCSTSF